MARQRRSEASRLAHAKRAAAARAARDVHTFLTIQPGCLYFDISDETPIGNKAKRAQDGGLHVDDLEDISPVWYGCNKIGITRDGSRVAFNTDYCREHLNDK